MALSGSITCSTSSSFLGATIRWSAKQDIATNTSKVTVSLYYYIKDPSTVTGAMVGAGTLALDATTRSYSNVYITGSGNTQVASLTMNLSHDSAGNCGFRITATGAATANKYFYLDQILRTASITAAPDFDDEDNPSISYSNPAGENVEALEACIADDVKGDVIVAYRAIPKTDITYTFNLTTAERNALRAKVSSGNSVDVRFYIRTTIGGTQYLHYLKKTFTIVGYAPTITPIVEDGDDQTYALTGDRNKFVKYYSDAIYSVGSAAHKGATITSTKVVCGAKSNTSETGSLDNVESATFVFSATDSRGNSVSQTVKKTLIEYVKLTCNLTAIAPTTSGVASFTVKGNYFNSSFGSQTNVLTYVYRHKQDGGNWGNWTAITATPTYKNNTYTITQSVSGLDYTLSHTFQVRVADKLMTVESKTYTVKTLPVFDWSGEDFEFNVPVTFNDKIYAGTNNMYYLNGSLGIYGTNTNGKNISSILPCNGNNNLVIGYGNWEDGLGATHIYGDNVRLYTNNAVEIKIGSKTYNLLDAAKLAVALTNTSSFTPTVTVGPNWSSASGTVDLVGSNLRFYFTAVRNEKTGSGDTANEVVCHFSFNHGNKVEAAYPISFVSGGSGAVSSYNITNATNSNGIIEFDISLCSVAAADNEFSAFFSMPVSLNPDAF